MYINTTGLVLRVTDYRTQQNTDRSDLDGGKLTVSARALRREAVSPPPPSCLLIPI